MTILPLGGLLLLAAGYPQHVPIIDAPVVDPAGVISHADAEAIAAKLRKHQTDTGVQMAVLIVDTTDGVPIEDFSIAVAEAWGGGTKGRDDGVLFTLAMRDRRMRVEVGTGLEPWIPDASAARLIAIIKPKMKAGDVSGAIHAVADGVIDATKDIKPGNTLGSPPFRVPLPLGLPLEVLVPMLFGIAAAIAVFVLRRRKMPRQKMNRATAAIIIGAFIAGALVFRTPMFWLNGFFAAVWGLCATLWVGLAFRRNTLSGIFCLPGVLLAHSMATGMFLTSGGTIHELRAPADGERLLYVSLGSLLIWFFAHLGVMIVLMMLSIPLVIPPLRNRIGNKVFAAISAMNPPGFFASSGGSSSSSSSSSSSGYRSSSSSSSSSSSGGYRGGGGGFSGGGASGGW